MAAEAFFCALEGADKIIQPLKCAVRRGERLPLEVHLRAVVGCQHQIPEREGVGAARFYIAEREDVAQRL